jgi:hypothetical protein
MAVVGAVTVTGQTDVDVTAVNGAITLFSGGAPPGLVLAGAGLPDMSASTPSDFAALALSTHYLQISIGGNPYYIPLSTTTW